MFLHLYHGRKNPNENLDDWGTDGGQFEIETMVCTYLSHVRVMPKGEKNWVELNFDEECVYYDGVYYGDFCVYDKPLEDIPISKLDATKTKLKTHA